MKPSELIGERSGLSRKVYMLVDERLPNHTQCRVSGKEHFQLPKNFSSLRWTSLLPMPPDELAAQIQAHITRFTSYQGLKHTLESQDNFHEVQKRLCGERTCEEFLNSNPYQGWKNRKTRGPSLLYVSGSGKLYPYNPCCKSTALT